MRGKRLRKNARRRVADFLDDKLEQRWEDGDDSASNAAVARRLHVVEKHVRDLRDATKALTVGDLLLSATLAEDVCRFVLSEVRRDEDRRVASDLVGTAARAEEVLLRSTGAERMRVEQAIAGTIEALQKALAEAKK